MSFTNIIVRKKAAENSQQNVPVFENTGNKIE